VHVNRARVVIAVISPHVTQQLSTGENSALVCGQMVEQIELGGREVKPAVPHGCSVAGMVDGQVT
jgi:hypothetical protein